MITKHSNEPKPLYITVSQSALLTIGVTLKFTSCICCSLFYVCVWCCYGSCHWTTERCFHRVCVV